MRRAARDRHDDCVALTQQLLRHATVNPPGLRYRPCATFLAQHLEGLGFETRLLEVDPQVPKTGTTEASRTLTDRSDRPNRAVPEDPEERVNVLGTLCTDTPSAVEESNGMRRAVHLNGHFDVVPVGEGWSMDPFEGLVRDGRIYGRGSTDMKAGLASAVYAAVALRDAGVRLHRPIDVSGTVDEESGGFAGVAQLCRDGWLDASRTACAIIPEPFGTNRVCLGHRGVYWGRITARGRIAHGSMPHLGTSALEPMTLLLERVRNEISPRIQRRLTAIPVVPEPSRRASLNWNSIVGGQIDDGLQTPCVMDRCSLVFDRRFLEEEDFATVRSELSELIDEIDASSPDWALELEDLMVVHPTSTDPRSALVRSLGSAVEEVTGEPCELVASPGTYDQKHVQRIGGVAECVAYGPGDLELAHQPDESCSLDALRTTTEVLALTLLDLCGDPVD